MEESTAYCEESSSIVAFGQPLFDAALGSLSLGADKLVVSTEVEAGNGKPVEPVCMKSLPFVLLQSA